MRAEVAPSARPMTKPVTDIIIKLRKWGVWNDARQYQDKLMQDFLAEDLPFHDAYELSWEYVREMFNDVPIPPEPEPVITPPEIEAKCQNDTLTLDPPPVIEPEEVVDDEAVAEAVEQAELEELSKRCEGNADDILRDINWVCNNLERQKITPRDCPSPSAWSLLKWARTHRDKFFTQTLPKALPKQVAGDDGNGDEDDADDELSIQELRSMLR